MILKFIEDSRERLFGPASQKGNAIVLTTLLITVLVGLTSFGIDIGKVYDQQRRIQFASDAGALAAANLLLGNTFTRTAIELEAGRVASYNSLSVAEIAVAGGIELGVWAADPITGTYGFAPVNGETFVRGVNNPIPNAVRVRARRQVGLSFGSVLGLNTMTPFANSIAVAGSYTEVFSNGGNCPLVPFGLELGDFQGTNCVDANGLPAPCQFGNRIVLDWRDTGNWGKVDIPIGANYSSGDAFRDAMVNGICDATVEVGDDYLGAPGNAAMGQTANAGGNGNGNGNGGDGGNGAQSPQSAFEERRILNPYIIIPIVDIFENGSHYVNIEGFAAAKIISVGAPGADNWTLTLELVSEYPGGNIGGPPSPLTFQNGRVLVQ